MLVKFLGRTDFCAWHTVCLEILDVFYPKFHLTAFAISFVDGFGWIVPVLRDNEPYIGSLGAYLDLGYDALLMFPTLCLVVQLEIPTYHNIVFTVRAMEFLQSLLGHSADGHNHWHPHNHREFDLHADRPFPHMNDEQDIVSCHRESGGPSWKEECLSRSEQAASHHWRTCLEHWSPPWFSCLKQVLAKKIMFFVAQLNYLLYSLHIEAVCITLIFSTLKVLLFLELHKKYSFFFC